MNNGINLDNNTIIAGYRITDKLYENQYISICRGNHIVNGECVILKILKPQGIASKDKLIRFRHEYVIMSKLNLPGVVNPVTLEEYEGYLIIVLTDIGGKQLDRFQVPFSIVQFFEFSIILADTIGSVHKRRIVYKNINPSTILWNPQTKKIILIDFSKADEVLEGNFTPQDRSAIEGTLEYISPEQTGRMNRAVDYRTDFYSLGILFYQLLTGQLPFSAPDPLGIIHLHIAGTAPGPRELKADIPEMVSSIVKKLMSKMADDRYQSTIGLKADLVRCFLEFTKTGTVRTFETGMDDLSETLRLPQKLYGRKKEVEQLISVLDLVSKRESGLVIVEGYSGIGKTALAHEISKYVFEKHGIFIEGKFDQLHNNVPYSGWIQALGELVNYILMESEADLSRWKKVILDALENKGKILIEVIPNLEQVIGPQPEVPELSGIDGQNRFKYVFLEFTRIIAGSEHELVVFLDDLQWVDDASLHLLQTLLTGGVSNVEIIGAYRDNEVEATHPIRRTIQSLQKQGIRVEKIKLSNLANDDVNELIADMLHCDPSYTETLTTAIMAGTGGNPFFILRTLQNLVQRQTLHYDTEDRSWKWENAAVLNLIEMCGNMVELMINNIRDLQMSTKNILSLAACIGFRFDPEYLSIISGKNIDTVLEDLQPAFLNGFIVQYNHYYRFVHDRVREAAYVLIPQDNRQITHLKIARVLLSQIDMSDIEENVFEIADQFNLGAGHIENQDERDSVAQLNLTAGKRAMNAIAYSSALAYFRAAESLLAKNSWHKQYSLRFELELKSSQCEFILGHMESAEKRLSALMCRAANLIDQAAVITLLCPLYIGMMRINRAVEVCIDYLHKVDITLTEHPTEEQARMALESLQQKLAVRSIETLEDLPALTDPVWNATMNILVLFNTAALYSDPNLMMLIAVYMVNISIEHGNDFASCSGYVMLGDCLETRLSDYAAGYRFGKLACDLMNRYGMNWLFPDIYLSFAVLISHWKKPIQISREWLKIADNAARQLGQIEIMSYAFVHRVLHMLFCGHPLEQAQRESEAGIEFTGRLHFSFVQIGIIGQRLFILALRGLTPELDSYKNGDFDVEAFEKKLTDKPQCAIASFFYRVFKLQVCFLAHKYATAIDYADTAGRILWTSQSFCIAADYHFYSALSRTALHDTASPDARKPLREAIDAHYAQLKIYADNCPENFANHAFLVEAEIARIEGRDQDAMRLYEQAVTSAHENGFVHNEAVAFEMAASFYRQRGVERISQIYLTEATTCYSRWGAKGKVRQLENLYPWLAGARQPETVPLAERLDAVSLAKAQTAISSEIEMDHLLGKVMRSVIENAGAQYGYLLMEKEGIWSVIAEGDVNRKKVEISPPAKIDNDDVVSSGIIRFVARTKTRIVLDNAAVVGEFVNDTHIRNKGTKSLLCTPLFHRGRLVSILYLENNLITHAFTPERVQFLEILLSQVAVSLEIATIYEELIKYRNHLEELVDKRTRELSESNAQLSIAKEQAESANKAKSTFLANMSHELRTPLNAILGFARLTRELPDVTAEQRKNLHIITLSGGHLLNLINNVLDMSKIESGRMTLEEERLDLYQLIQEMKSLLYVNAEERGLSFIVEQDQELPRYIILDDGKLRQVLINLIGNAIKYTKRGGIVLRAKVVEKRNEQVRLQFEVEDTGPGINEEDRKKLFKPFIQLKGQGAAVTGTGLGLSISRQFVELMGGHIDVISKKDKGSLFYFEIPVRELPLEEKAAVSEPGRVIGLEMGLPRYRILIAEDQLENRILLHKILEPFDFDIREAVNGMEAVEIFEKWHPDLIWMDIRMPVMDGLEATHRIKSADKGSHTKIIALTAQALEEDKIKIMHAGCDDFIRKPYRDREIFNALSTHLGLRFVYEEKPPAPPKEPEVELKPELLSVVPPELVKELHQAVIGLDPEGIQKKLRQIRQCDSAIGRVLQKLADKLDYGRLLQLLDEYAKRT